jgi:hypothetical protein
MFLFISNFLSGRLSQANQSQQRTLTEAKLQAKQQRAPRNLRRLEPSKGALCHSSRKYKVSAVRTKVRQDLVQQTVCCHAYRTRSPARRLNWQLYLNMVRLASKKGSKQASVSCIILL